MSNGEAPRETGLTVWSGVQGKIAALNQAAPSVQNLRGGERERQLAIRQMAEKKKAKQTLSQFIPGIDMTFIIDCTGSMGDDENAVQQHLPGFIGSAAVQALGDIPADIAREINPQRTITWRRFNFGDGCTESGYSQAPRIDNPWITTTSGEVNFNGNALQQGAAEVTSQFKAYHPHMDGGGNTGEWSMEALAASVESASNRQQHLALLNRILQDCRTLSGQTDPDAIVPYLEQMLGGGLPALLEGSQALRSQSRLYFLVTDEPAREHLVNVGDIANIGFQNGMLAIITPKRVGEHWQKIARELQGKWFDLADLTNAKTDAVGTSIAQQAIAAAIGKQVSQTVAADLSGLLQLTDGRKGNSSDSIVRV